MHEMNLLNNRGIRNPEYGLARQIYIFRNILKDSCSLNFKAIDNIFQKINKTDILEWKMSVLLH